jgi:hypothetical protein
MLKQTDETKTLQAWERGYFCGWEHGFREGWAKARLALDNGSYEKAFQEARLEPLEGAEQ